jgi:hypothetical protein
MLVHFVRVVVRVVQKLLLNTNNNQRESTLFNIKKRPQTQINKGQEALWEWRKGRDLNPR